ncbi:AraC family transcriptional regulator [Amnibacterium sp.]|uniref:AraC family transcriptional regulator n=1 Tax=Amnibacterium sp. TaxID=1872496 RepID=UPI0026079336|nr:AraC family transcriptional regulator [Amnibacterium sp.]MCU1474619.1 hypothetical protein [Amnibacterium sp.]
MTLTPSDGPADTRRGPLAETLVDTRDPLDAERTVGDVIGEHRIHARHPDAFHAVVTHTTIADLTIGHFEYGSPMAITAEPLDKYAINFALRGSFAVTSRGEQAAVGTSRSAMFVPGAESAMTWSGDLRTLCILIPADALERRFAILAGTYERPIRFALEDEAPASQLVLALVAAALRATRNGRREVPSPVAWELRDALLSTILLELPHADRGMLLAVPTSGTESLVQSAIEEMRRRMAAAPRVALIAAAIGTTERALRASFHEATGTTPSAYFKRMRLEAVRTALLRSSPQRTTVTRVAQDVGGFVHMGRFAGDYLQAFGEHPGESLRRGFKPHPNAVGAIRDWYEAVDPVWPEQRAG